MGTACISKKNEVTINQKNKTIIPRKKKSKITFKESNEIFESTINSFDLNSPQNNNKPSSTQNKKINKMIVSLDSNVFITKSSQEPDLVYFREKILGSGSFGTVYLVKHRELHKYFAMKVIQKNPHIN